MIIIRAGCPTLRVSLEKTTQTRRLNQITYEVIFHSRIHLLRITEEGESRRERERERGLNDDGERREYNCAGIPSLFHARQSHAKVPTEIHNAFVTTFI